MRRRAVGVAVIAVLLAAKPAPAQSDPSPGLVSSLDADERLVLATTAARPAPEVGWFVPVEAWVHEPETSRVRAGLIEEALDLAFDIELDDESRPRFEQRLAPFLVDNERGERVVVRFFGDPAQRRIELPRTEADGRARTEILIGADDAGRLARDGELRLIAVLPDGDARHITGRVLLQGLLGVTVISDIDDTVKLTGVGDIQRVLRATFVETFEAVPGMAALYRDWVDHGAALHFVSSSPAPLAESLEPFLIESGFPPATFHLMPFRVKDPHVLDLIAKGSHGKALQVRRLLEAWPERRFVLVGDTGERDPEIYSELLAQHPERVAAIALRNVTGATRDDERLGTLFADLPPERWMLFTSADQIRLPAGIWRGP